MTNPIHPEEVGELIDSGAAGAGWLREYYREQEEVEAEPSEAEIVAANYQMRVFGPK
jgi:hypothetical protein